MIETKDENELLLILWWIYSTFGSEVFTIATLIKREFDEPINMDRLNEHIDFLHFLNILENVPQTNSDETHYQINQTELWFKMCNHYHSQQIYMHSIRDYYFVFIQSLKRDYDKDTIDLLSTIDIETYVYDSPLHKTILFDLISYGIVERRRILNKPTTLTVLIKLSMLKSKINYCVELDGCTYDYRGVRITKIEIDLDYVTVHFNRASVRHKNTLLYSDIRLSKISFADNVTELQKNYAKIESSLIRSCGQTTIDTIEKYIGATSMLKSVFLKK